MTTGVARPFQAPLTDMTGMGETLQEFLNRHRAAAWDCHTRGRSCCAQLHEEFVRDLEHMVLPTPTRSQIRARILAQEGRLSDDH